MASGRTTEDDMREGLKSVGALSSLRTAAPMRRESIFAPAEQRTEHRTEETAPAPARAAAPAPREPDEPKAQPKAVAKPDAPARAAKPRAERPARTPQVVSAPAAQDAAQITQEPRGAPVLSDAPTVPMTAEMRSAATLLAAELQRRRTDKAERFTTNSIFRVAIERFLEDFKLQDGDHVNTERELLDLARTRKSR